MKKLKSVKIKYLGKFPKVEVSGVGEFTQKENELTINIPEYVLIKGMPGNPPKFGILEFPENRWLMQWRAINGMRTDTKNFKIEDVFEEDKDKKGGKD